VTIQSDVAWSNVLQPINADNTSIFKIGSTIPAKFVLTGASSGIANLAAKLYLAKVSNGVVGSELEAASTSAADAGNTFRNDAMADSYIFKSIHERLHRWHLPNTHRPWRWCHTYGLDFVEEVTLRSKLPS
jgi:hypothetical protein